MKTTKLLLLGHLQQLHLFIHEHFQYKKQNTKLIQKRKRNSE